MLQALWICDSGKEAMPVSHCFCGPSEHDLCGTRTGQARRHKMCDYTWSTYYPFFRGRVFNDTFNVSKVANRSLVFWNRLLPGPREGVSAAGRKFEPDVPLPVPRPASPATSWAAPLIVMSKALRWSLNYKGPDLSHLLHRIDAIP